MSLSPVNCFPASTGHTENPVALIQLAYTNVTILSHIARWNWPSSKTYTALEELKDRIHDSKIK
jgi:hypothetical protein